MVLSREAVKLRTCPPVQAGRMGFFCNQLSSTTSVYKSSAVLGGDKDIGIHIDQVKGNVNFLHAKSCNGGNLKVLCNAPGYNANLLKWKQLLEYG